MNWGYQNLMSDGRFYGFLLAASIVDIILRGFALWKSAQKNQKVWFVALLIVNSMGILPLIYLLIDKFSKSSKKK